MKARLSYLSLIVVTLISVAKAELYADLPLGYVWQHNAQVPKAAPMWIENTTSQQPKTYLATETFSFTPTAETQGLDLAITVYFDESYGHFLRVFWQSDMSSVSLTNNLYEDIGMINQRILLIPNEDLHHAANLIFQSGDFEHSIIKIKFQWLKPQIVSLPATAEDTALIDNQNNPRTAYDVSGQPLLEIQDHTLLDVVRAPIITLPERIEDIVEFVFELKDLPNVARLEAKIAGLPLLAETRLWLNNQELGIINLEVPSLIDPGYHWSNKLDYLGWRSASILIHPDMLVEGTNRLIIDWNNPDFPQDATPVAIRDLILELSYANPPILKSDANNTDSKTQKQNFIPPENMQLRSEELDILIEELELIQDINQQ